MKSEKVKIGSIKTNPNNPRLIKDDKFMKLVKSIKEFPKMLEIRPIVVNDDMVVLGGNMRLKACKEAGLTEVPIIRASDLTEEEQKEFIIKDNVGFGEWDWEVLANEWDGEKLGEWGMDINFDDNMAEPEDLIGEGKDNPCAIKITSKKGKGELDLILQEITPILDRYSCDWSFR